MLLRKLEFVDADGMLSWMRDVEVISGLHKEFNKMTIADCYSFIERANTDAGKNIHRAVCNDENEYLGTVSLKNIDDQSRNAEYAIVVRREAMGTGAALFATEGILRIAFERLMLNRIYLNVFSDNIRAKKFYSKLNFTYEGTFRQHILSADGMIHDLDWYGILRDTYEKYGVLKEHPC